MIPPCDSTILAHNPHFKRLYQHLTTAVLSPDGSTRAIDAQPARREVRNELRSCQVRNAKKQIKKQTLRQLAFDPDNGLPDDCREPLAIVSLYLESSPNQLDLVNDSRDGAHVNTLIAPDIENFYSKLPTIVLHFTRALSSAVRDLRSLANAGDATVPNESKESSRSQMQARSRAKAARQSPLSPQLDERVKALRHIQLSELAAARTQMAATAAEVLAMRAAILERTVTLLERTKHGALARATKAKAEHLATVAHGVEGKSRVMSLDVLATIHTPEVNAALSRYHKHLRDTHARLEERRDLALEELKAYENVDSNTMKGPVKSGPIAEIARRYGSLLREIEDVKSEIQQLQKQHTQIGHLTTPPKVFWSKYAITFKSLLNATENTNFVKKKTRNNMADDAISIYDEIEIEDMTFDPNLQIYHYPCPCGDRFEIVIDDLRDGEDIAVCPSCSLMIKVIFDESDLPKEDKQQAPGVSVKA
ncbi:hypothetical protein BJX76DRAFT_360579 [Aspergillus varians]